MIRICRTVGDPSICTVKGAAENLRTVTAFYPVVANDLRSGLVRSIRHEDGTLDLYDYSLVSNLWTRTVTHLHEQSPSPVSGKTTRDITTTNSRGEILEEKTEAYIGEVWYTIARETMTYNPQGKRITSENLAGQVTTTSWDQFACTPVGELVSAAKNAKSAKHACDFGEIGNRETASERGTNSVYAANELNQYSSITTLTSDVGLQTSSFFPQFDDDGNQTLIKTSTGIWSVTYNGENRPIHWQCQQSNNQTVTNNQTILMSFDRMGRRVEYLETTATGNSTITTNAHNRFVYNGYLCVQRLDAANNNDVNLLVVWDPTEPVATRPLFMMQSGGHAFFCTHDGNKNVSEVFFFQQAYGIAAHYEYAPFGAVTAATRNTSVTSIDACTFNPFRFLSEYADDTLGLVYYNYRHYNPVDGRWMCRDLLHNVNLMAYLSNTPMVKGDVLGLLKQGDVLEVRDGWFDVRKGNVGSIEVQSLSLNTKGFSDEMRHQFVIALFFTPGDSFSKKCCKEDLRWIQWILSDTDIDPTLPKVEKYPKLDALEGEVYYPMERGMEEKLKRKTDVQLNKAEEGQPSVVWTSTGSFRFADSPTVYKRLGEGETRVKFKTCLVCDKTKYGCDGVKGNVKKVQSVCYSELYCLE